MLEKLKLIVVLAKSDFQKRFIGSFLGIFWMFVQPVVSVVIYYCVFQLGFRNNPVDGIPYVVWLLPGIVPWFFFNDAVSNGVSSVESYKNWIKKLSFDVRIVPMVRVTASFFLHLLFMIVMIVVLLIYGCTPTLWWLQCLYYEVANLVLVIALSYLTSSINVFVKDMGQFVNVLLQFGFWVAPIMYNPEIMPDWIQAILKWNPFTYIVVGYRDSFLFGTGFWTKQADTLQFWIITLALFVLGNVVYRRLQPHFADVL